MVLSANRPEWFVTNLAGMTVGARVAGIYTNNTPEQCHYIAEHAEAVVAVVDSPQALARLGPEGSRPASLRTIVLLEGEAEGPGVVSWEEFLAAGEPSHEAEVARRRAALTGDSPTTLIYTSGTTGTPKAVMLTQRQPRLHRREDPGAGADRHRGLADQLPAALAHRRAGRLAPALDRDGRRGPLHREPRQAAREPAPRCGRTSSSACRACGRRCRRRSRRRAPRRARCAEEIVGLGARGRPAHAATPTRPAGPALELRARRPARLLEGARAARARPRAAAGGLVGADREGDARVLPEPGPADHGGLRDERVHAGRRRCRFPRAIGSAGPATRSRAPS